MVDAPIEAIARAFLDAAQWQQRPRSVSGPIAFAGRRYYCKHTNEDLGAEAALLAASRALPATPGVRAVQFVGYDPAANVLITRPVAGVSLFNGVWNGTSPWRPWAVAQRQWHEPVRRLARWARSLSLLSTCDQVPNRSRRQATDYIVHETLARIARVRPYRLPAFADGELDRLTELTVDLAGDAGWHRLPLSVIHGDLTLSNVMVEPGGALVVLDFGNARHGYALEDAARLWCSVWEVAGCGRLRRHWLAPAPDAVLDGFGLDSHVVDTAPFTLLRIWNGVTRLHEATSDLASYGRGGARLHAALLNQHARWMRGLLGGGAGRRLAA